MKERLILLSSYTLLAFRFMLAMAFFQTSSFSAWLLGIVGVIAIATTVIAWSEGNPDLTWTGIGVGVGHLSVLMLRPGEIEWKIFAPLFWCLFVLQCWVKWHLGRCCTVTGPVFVNVVASGPYRWVRHPMTATELLIAVVFALQFPSFWNLWAVSFVVVSKFVLTLWEENFLMRQQAYRGYALTVRWRFYPGIW